MRGIRHFNGWTLYPKRKEFRRTGEGGVVEVVPVDSKAGMALRNALWHRDGAVPPIPRDAWWLARFSNVLLERFGQLIDDPVVGSEVIIDYEAASVFWLLRRLYWAGHRDGLHAAKGERRSTGAKRSPVSSAGAPTPGQRQP